MFILYKPKLLHSWSFIMFIDNGKKINLKNAHTADVSGQQGQTFTKMFKKCQFFIIFGITMRYALLIHEICYKMWEFLENSTLSCGKNQWPRSYKRVIIEQNGMRL